MSNDTSSRSREELRRELAETLQRLFALMLVAVSLSLAAQKLVSA